MKTRIISGAVAVVLLIAVLIANSYWSPTAVIFVALLAALASYEMLCNTGCVKNKTVVGGAILYSAVTQFCYAGILPVDAAVFGVLYAFLIVGVALKDHKSFTPDKITMSLSMPLLLSYAFAALVGLLNRADGFGLFYLIMLLNFSSICDCFAYFVGSAVGKHKLAPVISPKKTVEGSVGGVIGSVIGTVVICIAFGAVTEADANIWILCAVTPFMCVIGMLGDLFTSAIKRSYGIKDYGNIMPGHGGVLDRFDSILLCAPAMSLFLDYVEVIA